LLEFESVSLGGISAVKADGAAMKALIGGAEELLGEESIVARGLGYFEEGFAGSFAELSGKGRLDMDAPWRSIAGEVGVSKANLATLPDARKTAGFSNLSARVGLAYAPVKNTNRLSLRLVDGQVTADKVQIDSNVFTKCTATAAGWDETLSIPLISFVLDEGSFRGDATMRKGRGLERVGLKFTGLNQALMAAKFAPQRFSAEGKTAGSFELVREENGGFAGKLTLTADTDGKLAFSKEVAAEQLAAASKATAAQIAASGATLPSNFPNITESQLKDYPYTSGKATIADTAEGISISLDYSRAPLRPTDPGYGAEVTMGGRQTSVNIALNLKDVAITVPGTTVGRVMARGLGMEGFLGGAAEER
jgi:hypothetical protein